MKVQYEYAPICTQRESLHRTVSRDLAQANILMLLVLVLHSTMHIVLSEVWMRREWKNRPTDRKSGDLMGFHRENNSPIKMCEGLLRSGPPNQHQQGLHPVAGNSLLRPTLHYSAPLIIIAGLQAESSPRHLHLLGLKLNIVWGAAFWKQDWKFSSSDSRSLMTSGKTEHLTYLYCTGLV